MSSSFSIDNDIKNRYTPNCGADATQGISHTIAYKAFFIRTNLPRIKEVRASPSLMMMMILFKNSQKPHGFIMMFMLQLTEEFDLPDC